MPRPLPLLLAAFLFSWIVPPVFAADSPTPPLSLWVWNRTTPLKKSELTALRDAHVTELWWNVGTLARRNQSWAGTESLALPHTPIPAPQEIRILPVIRLHEGSATLLDATANAQLAPLLKTLAAKFSAPVIQLDYDCPDKLLPRYAEVLRACRSAMAPVKLSATALAHWPKVEGFAAFCASVDEVMPMFYDLEASDRLNLRDGWAPPLADAERLSVWIQGWKNCPTPWRAGLPNFTRITLFDAQARSHGHLLEWRWEAMVFDPVLRVVADTRQGATLLQAEKAGVMGRTPFEAGQQLLVRWPDPQVLRGAVREATDAGAAGIIFFKLPEAEKPGGASLSELVQLSSPDAKAADKDKDKGFTLTLEGAHLVLRNPTPFDLPPRFATVAQPDDRGWTLELAAPIGAVREVAPGEFTAVDHSIEKAQEFFRFHLAWLRASDKITTGFFQMAGGAAASKLQWRIEKISPVWKPLLGTSP